MKSTPKRNLKTAKPYGEYGVVIESFAPVEDDYDGARIFWTRWHDLYWQKRWKEALGIASLRYRRRFRPLNPCSFQFLPFSAGQNQVMTTPASPSAAAPSAQQERPNVIFILTDDQGYGELGYTGNEYIHTPHLDELANSPHTVQFTDHHSGTTCAPTRSGLLTGHYANSTGCWHTIGGHSLLREDEFTLPQALGQVGYSTAHFGKWHLGDATPLRPFERGFDLSIYHGGGGVGNTPDAWGNGEDEK